MISYMITYSFNYLHMNGISSDVLIHASQFMLPKDILSLQQTCRYVYNALESPYVWAFQVNRFVPLKKLAFKLSPHCSAYIFLNVGYTERLHEYRKQLNERLPRGYKFVGFSCFGNNNYMSKKTSERISGALDTLGLRQFGDSIVIQHDGSCNSVGMHFDKCYCAEDMIAYVENVVKHIDDGDSHCCIWGGPKVFKYREGKYDFVHIEYESESG